MNERPDRYNASKMIALNKRYTNCAPPPPTRNVREKKKAQFMPAAFAQ